MSLRDAIAATRARVKRPKVRTLSEVPILNGTVAYVAERFPETASIPPVEQLFEVADRLRHATEAGNWSGLSRRDIRRAPLCIWMKERPLAHVPGAVDRLLEALRQRRSKSAYRSLIAAYIRDFGVDDPSFAMVAEELKAAVVQWDWVWVERSARHELFDPKVAPQRVADHVIGSELPVQDVLKDLGFDGTLASGGLARAAYLAALQVVGAGLASNALTESSKGRIIERVLAWAIDGNEIRYSGTTPTLVDALVLPWADKNPPEDLQQTIQGFLVGHLRDPRVHPERWHGVSEASMRIVRRWLAQASLEQYLEVVDEITGDPEARFMWQFRRAFWRSFFEADFLQEAWVAFAREGAHVARAAFKSSAEFGRLRSDYRVQPNHAVLIMRIGGLVVADWSHNGKCHIWLANNDDAPSLYDSVYGRAELTTGSDNGGVSHTSSRTANWQQKISSYIRDNTGITIHGREYMPRRWKRRG